MMQQCKHIFSVVHYCTSYWQQRHNEPIAFILGGFIRQFKGKYLQQRCPHQRKSAAAVTTEQSEPRTHEFCSSPQSVVAFLLLCISQISFILTTKVRLQDHVKWVHTMEVVLLV